MISLAELAAMQATANSALPDTAQIQRVTNTPDGYGSSSQTWSVMATVACLLSRPQGAYMQNLAERLGEIANWQVVVPADTDVRVADRLVTDSQTLTVQAVYGPESNEVLRVVLASEVRP